MKILTTDENFVEDPHMWLVLRSSSNSNPSFYFFV